MVGKLVGEEARWVGWEVLDFVRVLGSGMVLSELYLSRGAAAQRQGTLLRPLVDRLLS